MRRSVGDSAIALAVVLAIIAWLSVYRNAFNTGWLSTLGIVIIGWIILLIMDTMLIAIFGATIPKFYPF